MRCFFLIFFCCFLLQRLNADQVTVCKSCKIKSLAEAVALADHADTIVVMPGTYSCANLNLTKPVTIRGTSGTILDGQGEGYVIRILSSDVHISNMKIINSGRSYTKDYAAIYAFMATDFSINDLEISDPFFGILLEKSSNGHIDHNRVYGTSEKEDDSGNGIHLWHCRQMNIVNNEIYGLRDGIYLEFVDSSTIQNNYAHNNIRYGLHFMFSNHDRYVANRFESNGAGVAVMFSKSIVMQSNLFLKNWGTASYGLLLKEIYDAQVISNQFVENTIAIYVDGSTRVDYFRNDLTRNGWAVKVSGGCYQNRFSTNNFLSNSFDVSYNTRMNDNEFYGNYWSEYAGYDLDQNGIGDVPYRPVKLFSYVVNRTPETIVLLRSLFVDIINFSEKVSPIFTPQDLIDTTPSIQPFR